MFHRHRLSPASLFAFLLFGTSIAFTQETYIPFEGTHSPDGRYCLGWGIQGQRIDTTNGEKLIRELDLESVENYLIDLQLNRVIATIGSNHFAWKDFHKNRGSIAALWRADSRALLVEEAARFGSALVVLIEIIEPDHAYDPCSDVIPLTRSLKRAARFKMMQEHPAKSETIANFAISFYPQRWTKSNSVVLNTIGEIPKDEDAFVYQGEMEFELPNIKLRAK